MSEELSPIKLHPTESAAIQVFLSALLTMLFTNHENDITLALSAIIVLSLIASTASICFRQRPKKRIS